MEWLGALTNVLSIGSGGILGVFTAIFGTYFKYKEQQEVNKFKLAMLKAESEANINEIKAQIEINKVITEGAIQLEENKADTMASAGFGSLIQSLTGKYLSDSILKIMLEDSTKVGLVFRPLIYLHVLFMDFVRGMIRPTLTVGIVWYVTYIIDISLEEYLIDDFGSENLMAMVIRPAIQLILFSASTVVAFWFADKSMSRRFQKGTNNGI